MPNLNEEKFKKQFGEKRARSQTCDCVNPDDLKKLRASVKAKWGNLDIVVANVGDGQSVSDPIPCKNEWKKYKTAPEPLHPKSVSCPAAAP